MTMIMRQKHIWKILAFAFLVFFFSDDLFKGQEIFYPEFLELLETDDIKKITIITYSSGQKDIGSRVSVITKEGLKKSL